MYKFAHRELKKKTGARLRTPEAINKYAIAMAEKVKSVNLKIAGQAVAYLKTLGLEADWLENPNVIYLSKPMQESLIRVGKDAGIQNVNPSIAKACVIGTFIYQVDREDERSLAYAFNKDDGSYYREVCIDDKNAADDEFVQLLSGLSVYLYSFPDALKDGPPSPQLKPVNRYEVTRHLVGHKDTSGPTRCFVRRPHFRVLGDKRFKHNADGSPKIILVKEAEVKMSPEQISKHLKNNGDTH